MLRQEEIGQAYQFGNEATVKNVLESNWWESSEQQEEQRQVAGEVLRLDEKKRRAMDDDEDLYGEGDVNVDEKDKVKKSITEKEKRRVIARTRVGAYLI